MNITREEIERFARLAHLRFESQELERFSGEFTAILNYFESLETLYTSGIEPTSHVTAAMRTVADLYRPDESRPGLPLEEVLRESPEKKAGHFLVPKFIG